MCVTACINFLLTLKHWTVFFLLSFINMNSTYIMCIWMYYSKDMTMSLDCTCLASTAAVYSLPNVSSVRATSSRMMLKSRARSVNSLRINRLTCWRCVINCDALNLATTLFNTCSTYETTGGFSSWHPRHTAVQITVLNGQHYKLNWDSMFHTYAGHLGHMLHAHTNLRSASIRDWQH